MDHRNAALIARLNKVRNPYLSIHYGWHFLSDDRPLGSGSIWVAFFGDGDWCRDHYPVRMDLGRAVRALQPAIKPTTYE
jgi:hypothetical protein